MYLTSFIEIPFYADYRAERQSSSSQTTMTIKMKIVKKSKSLLTYNGPNGKMTYFNIIGAHDKKTQLFKVYKAAEYSKTIVGMTYEFEDVILKPDSSMWVVGSSRIGFTAPVDYDNELEIPLLPEDEPKLGVKRSLQQALLSPTKSTIRAKVVKVSPVKFRCEGTLAVRCLGLKDETGFAKVVVFDKAAEAAYTPNASIEVTAVYPKTWKNQPQLNFSKSSDFQFITSSDVPCEVTEADQEHFAKDGDFCLETREDSQTLDLNTIYEVTSYDVCSNEACHKKKLINGVCPTCQGDTHVWTYRAKVCITGKDLKKEVVLFQNNLEKLFGKVEERSDDLLICWMVSKLPVQFTAKVLGNNLYKIEKNQLNFIYIHVYIMYTISILKVTSSIVKKQS